MRTLKNFYNVSTYVALFVIVMFVIETFFPLGNKVCYYFGSFGMLVGKLITLWGLVGMIKFVVDFINKYENK